MLPSTSAKHLLATLATAPGCAWERDRCWPPRLRRRGLRRLHQMSAELHSLRTACFYNLMDTRCSIAGTDASSLGFIGKPEQRKRTNTSQQCISNGHTTAKHSRANFSKPMYKSTSLCASHRTPRRPQIKAPLYKTKHSNTKHAKAT